MLDIKFIRENPDVVKWACKVKGFDDHTGEIIALDKQVRELKTTTQTKTAEKNKITAQIAAADACARAPLVAESKKIGADIANDEAELKTAEEKLNELLHMVPQVPSKDAPIGKDESDNVEISKTGVPRNFDFTPRAHWDIMDLNNWWMPDALPKISGPRTYMLLGEAAELDLAIQTFVVQKLIKKGFIFANVPALVKKEAIFDAGHFMGSDMSVMDNDVFMTTDGKCLAGTAEIVLNSLHAGEILPEDKLPIMYAGYSPCFRKEAGAAGRDTRGLIRVHQFHKVEQYVYCKPEQSNEMHEFLLNNLQEVFSDLEVPFHTIANCTGDMGFNKVKMHDVEAWMPSEAAYREVGSCSSIGEFQARRTNTRYRENGTNEVKFVATLNNTAVALPRALVMVLENHQNADGSVNVPKALQPLMGGRKTIGGKK
jgi:seryl-tRNA synthetase